MTGITEASAMVLSRRHPGHVIICNDEDGPFFYVRISDNRIVARFRIKPKTRDTESLAIDAAGYLCIGDTGNNKLKYKNVTLYRLPEPELRDYAKPLPVQKIKYKWPKGKRQNCEAMLIHPQASTVKFISKAQAGRLYTPEGKLLKPGPQQLPRMVTDGTYGVDGRRAYLTRKDAHDIHVFDGYTWQLLGAFPAPPLPKCESITAVDSTRLLIGSEGTPSPIVTVTIPPEFR